LLLLVSLSTSNPLNCVAPVCVNGTPNPKEPMPVNLTVAFIGDQGLAKTSKDVLKIIKQEGAEIVIHSGDFDYENNPSAWDQQISDILGKQYPYFSCIGNHDVDNWNVSNGYQQTIYNRWKRAGVTTCKGEVGINTVCSWKGLTFVLSGVGTLGENHESFIDKSFNQYGSVWRVCSWHKNQRLMQTGGQTDEVGWGVYETCRKHGAFIATAHQHNYARSLTMSNITSQVIANRSTTSLITSPGLSFVFCHGVGGHDTTKCRDGLENSPWWATALCSNGKVPVQSAALICKFNLNGKKRPSTVLLDAS